MLIGTSLALAHSCFWQEDSHPAVYLRVVRRGRLWSLDGDVGLHQQLGWNVGTEIDVYDDHARLWTPFKTHQPLPITGVGCCLYVRKPGVICTPLFPTIRARMFACIPFPREEETLLHYFKPK